MPIFRTRLALIAPCALLGLPAPVAMANKSPGIEGTFGDSAVFLHWDARLVVPSDERPTMSRATSQGGLEVAALRLDTDFAQYGARAESRVALDRDTTALSGAAVAPSRLVKIMSGDSLMHDSNVFRLASGVDPRTALGVSSKADTINMVYVGLSIDKDYAQQRFQLDLTETAYRYANHSSLNYEAFEYRGAWHWHVTPRWGGVVSAERRIGTASFADTQLTQRTQRNLRTGDNLRLSLDGSLGGGWHALLGAFQYQLKYEQGFLPQNSSRTRGAEVGVRYERPSGNALTLMQRSTRGEYLNRVPDILSLTDNAFRQNELELKLDWQPGGGKSTVRGRLAWVDVRHEHFAGRDFSGLGGEVAYVWVPSGKLRFETVYRRDLAPWWQTYSSYRVDDTLSITPVWQVGVKTALRARLEHTHSDFRKPVPGYGGALRGDTLRSALLGVDWHPLRSLTLDAGLQRQWRRSNFSGADFDATIASLNARLKF